MAIFFLKIWRTLANMDCTKKFANCIFHANFSLMTTLDFNSVPSDPYSNTGGLNPEITRIKTLIEAIENYGVDRKYIFKVEDLFEKKHIPRVVRCLEEIEKLVSFRIQTFKDILNKFWSIFRQGKKNMWTFNPCL